MNLGFNENGGAVYYNKWSKNFDYEKWYVKTLIGEGAFAKVYLVWHISK